MDRLTIGGKLKKLRKAEGMTQQVLADEFNIKQDDISRYENDKQELNLSILSLYCKRFKVSADYLLGLTETPTVDTNVRAVCDYTGLSEEAIHYLRYSVRTWQKTTLPTDTLSICNQFIEKGSFSLLIEAMSDYYNELESATNVIGSAARTLKEMYDERSE